MGSLAHSFPFDPGYGYDLDRLLSVSPPPVPADFAEFWTRRYPRARAVDPAPRLDASPLRHTQFRVHELQYRSTGGFTIGGWLLEPVARTPTRGFVMGHGYGGIEGPDFAVPCGDAVYLWPCFRGLGRSRRPPISDNPAYHVLHDIQSREHYLLGGCVEDLWCGVSALTALFPRLAGHLGYLGISFGGGIGALALPWEERLCRAHLNVPTFGHQPLRLQLPTVGSAAAVQGYARHHSHVLETLCYYDAAVAARFIEQPVHVAAARFDPAVAPPGQFAVYNALAGPKKLFVLTAGHFDYPAREQEEQDLRAELAEFFAPL